MNVELVSKQNVPDFITKQLEEMFGMQTTLSVMQKAALDYAIESLAKWEYIIHESEKAIYKEVMDALEVVDTEEITNIDYDESFGISFETDKHEFHIDINYDDKEFNCYVTE